MKSLKYLFLIVAALFSTAVVLSSCSDDDHDNNQEEYDVIKINGESYACYGYRSLVTYSSDWNLSSHKGSLLLPCGKLSDAQKGEYDYDDLFEIKLKGDQDLKKGSKLENFSPIFEVLETGAEIWEYNHVSGSATITDKKDDEYITVKFDSFKFTVSSESYDFNGSGAVPNSESYVLNGTVQLSLDED